MKVIAVTVTYNRLSLLKKNVEAILNQTYEPDEFIIIDNCSTDGTIEYLQALENSSPKVHVVYMSENNGGSAGFEEGIRKAYQHGADYIFGMDDDAIPHKDALEILVNATQNYPPVKFCLRANTHYMDNNNQFAKAQLTENDINGCNLTFVGFFIPREIVSRIGYPRGDLFVYYDEHDYCLRMKEAGYHIQGVLDSIVEHPYIMPDNKRCLFGRLVDVPVMPTWKMYYWMRNNLLIRRGMPGREFWKNLQLELYVLLKIIIFKPEQFHAAVVGLVDGIAGKAGRRAGYPN